MRELLKPHINSPRNLDELRELVIAAGLYLLKHHPNEPIEYVGGPITADGPEWIDRNLLLLAKAADYVRKRDGVRTYTNPYVGDLRRFQGVGEREFSLYSATLLRSGVFHRIILLEGWQRSKGSRDEHMTALALDIPVRELALAELGFD